MEAINFNLSSLIALFHLSIGGAAGFELRAGACHLVALETRRLELLRGKGMGEEEGREGGWGG